MTTIARRPLGIRQPEQSVKLEKTVSSFSSTRQACFLTPTPKRPRSPDLDDVNYSKKCKNTSQATVSKTKITLSTARDTRDPEDRLRQKQQRQLANQEFITKYTKAFPTFVFFFDERCGGRHQVESSILALGGRIEHFFSAHVTDNNYDKLVRDAVRLNRKIWNLPKLESVLSRLINSSVRSKVEELSAPLTQLLEKERINGTTERDPKEKRHDYQYFSKGSHFFLVEDIRGEVAPIAIMEYTSLSRNDKTPSYPVLYMDPRARSPFTKYDEKEARKLEKIEANEKLRDAERARRHAKVKELLKKDNGVRAANHLRRRASMSNLEEQVISLGKHCPDVDSLENSGMNNSTARCRGDDQVASGIAPSTLGLGNGYLAASGNSVIITSTTTTSLARNLNSTRLPPNLREQLGRQVIMNRKLDASAREETKKPGYCEACRVKFEDFTAHLRGNRHRKFARNDDNYTELDNLLGRLERKTLSERELIIPFRETPFILPEPEFQETEPSDGSLGPGDYFYVPRRGSEADNQLEQNSIIEEAEVEVEVDDEDGYIILDDD